MVVTEAAKPAPGKLIIARDVVAAGMLYSVRLGTAAQDVFRAPDKGTVNGPLQWPPTDRGVRAPQCCPKATEVEVGNAGRVMSVGIGDAKINIGAFRDVLVSPEMSNVGQLSTLTRVENVV